jgi:hypothetical protein
MAGAVVAPILVLAILVVVKKLVAGGEREG